jgi:hypothetical protein
VNCIRKSIMYTTDSSMCKGNCVAYTKCAKGKKSHHSTSCSVDHYSKAKFTTSTQTKRGKRPHNDISLQSFSFQRSSSDSEIHPYSFKANSSWSPPQIQGTKQPTLSCTSHPMSSSYYAGPVFHKSPAPSSLPAPIFHSSTQTVNSGTTTSTTMQNKIPNSINVSRRRGSLPIPSYCSQRSCFPEQNSLLSFSSSPTSYPPYDKSLVSFPKDEFKPKSFPSTFNTDSLSFVEPCKEAIQSSCAYSYCQTSSNDSMRNHSRQLLMSLLGIPSDGDRNMMHPAALSQSYNEHCR